jgi:hypothetical protein
MMCGGALTAVLLRGRRRGIRDMGTYMWEQEKRGIGGD